MSKQQNRMDGLQSVEPRNSMPVLLDNEALQAKVSDSAMITISFTVTGRQLKSGLLERLKTENLLGSVMVYTTWRDICKKGD